MPLLVKDEIESRKGVAPVAARGRVRELDGLRAVAVLAVFAFHATVGTHLANPVTGLGWAGVDLFFVLSGYLITNILLDSRTRPDYFRRFYARRCRRIFPLYYLVLAVYATAVLARPWPYWLVHAAFLSSTVEYFHYFPFPAPVFVYAGASVLWSLSIEEQFYLVWAPVVRWMTGRWLPVLLGVIVMGAPVLRFLLHRDFYPEYRFFPARFDAIAWGAVLALTLRTWPRERAARRLGVAAVVAAAGLALLLYWTGGRRESLWFATFGYSGLGILFAAVVGGGVLGAESRTWICRWLRLRPLQHVGRTSYAIYLFHYPLIALAAGWLDPRLGYSGEAAAARGLVALTAALLLASASWRWLESPLLKG